MIPLSQCLIVLTTFLLILSWPPRTGAMLLIPLRAESPGKALALALARDAVLIGRGPFGGSFVVYGQRDAILPVLNEAGVLVLASPSAGCGGSFAAARRA